MSNELKSLFGFMAELGGDLEEFLNALYEGKVNRDQVPGLTDDTESAMKKALEQIGKAGGDPTDLDPLWEAAEANLPKPAPEKKLRAWEKVAKATKANGSSPAQVEVDDHKKSAAKADDLDLPAEDVREWNEKQLKLTLLDLFDNGHKKHSLPFELSSEETARQLDRMMGQVAESVEPVTTEMLSKWVNNRFAGIARSRNSRQLVEKDLAGFRVDDIVFEHLKKLVRGNYDKAACEYAARLTDAGASTDQVIKVIDRVAALGYNEENFDLVSRHVIGKTPGQLSRSTETRDTEEEPAVGRAFARRGRDRQPEPAPARKKRAWDRG